MHQLAGNWVDDGTVLTATVFLHYKIYLKYIPENLKMDIKDIKNLNSFLFWGFNFSCVSKLNI